MFQALGNMMQGVANALGATSSWGYIQNDSGLVMDVANNNRNAGAKLCVWSRNSPVTDNQLFRFEGRELICKMNGFAVTNNGGRLFLYPRNGRPEQQWWFDGNMLKNQVDNKALDIEGGATQGRDLITWQPHGQVNQRWRHMPVPGYDAPAPSMPSPAPMPYMPSGPVHGWIQNESGLVLDVAGENRNPGAKLCAWQKKIPPADNQLFAFEGREVISKMNGFALTNNGGRMFLYPRNGRPEQQFWFEGAILKCAIDGKAMDIEGGASQGKDIILWQPHGQSNQRWSFVPVGAPCCAPMPPPSYAQPAYPPQPAYAPQPTFVPVPVPVPVPTVVPGGYPMPCGGRTVYCRETRCSYFMKDCPAPHTHDVSCNDIHCPYFMKHGCPRHSFTAGVLN